MKGVGFGLLQAFLRLAGSIRDRIIINRPSLVDRGLFPVAPGLLR
jgi:hypothetical protein